MKLARQKAEMEVRLARERRRAQEEALKKLTNGKERIHVHHHYFHTGAKPASVQTKEKVKIAAEKAVSNEGNDKVSKEQRKEKDAPQSNEEAKVLNVNTL